MAKPSKLYDLEGFLFLSYSNFTIKTIKNVPLSVPLFYVYIGAPILV